MANRATDSHTHKGVVSLVILIAHGVNAASWQRWFPPAGRQ